MPLSASRPEALAPTSAEPARRSQRRNSGLVGLWGCGVFLTMACGLLAVAAFRAPLGYDESYNLQIVGNLLAGRGYATNGVFFGGRPELFDYYISTGPTVMLPVTGLAWLVGQHVWVYRVFPLGAFVGLVAAWVVVGRRYAGWPAGVAGGLAVLALDPLAATWSTSPLPGPGAVMGEVTGAVLLVLAALSWRRTVSCGLLVGLALMTKVLLALALPSFLIAVLLAAGEGRRHRTAAAFLGGFAAPVLLWQLVRVAVLGPSGAWRVDQQFMRFFMSGGSGLNASPGRVSLLSRIRLQEGALSAAGALALAVAVALLITHLSGRGRGLRTWFTSAHAPVLILASVGLVNEAWWLCISDRAFVRHSIVGMYLVVPAVIVALAGARQWLATQWWLRGASGLVIVGLVIATCANVVQAFHTPGPSLAEQRKVAAVVSQRAPGGQFATISWKQVAELPVLAPITAHLLTADGGALLVLTQNYGISSFASELARCGKVVLDEYGYVVCWALPGDTGSAGH